MHKIKVHLAPTKPLLGARATRKMPGQPTF